MKCLSCNKIKKIRANDQCSSCYYRNYRAKRASNNICIECKNYPISKNRSKYYCRNCLARKRHLQQFIRDILAKENITYGIKEKWISELAALKLDEVYNEPNALIAEGIAPEKSLPQRIEMLCISSTPQEEKDKDSQRSFNLTDKIIAQPIESNEVVFNNIRQAKEKAMM